MHHAQQHVHGKRKPPKVASFDWSDDLIEAAVMDTESSALYPPTGAVAKAHNKSSVPAIFASTGTLQKSASANSTNSAPTALTRKLQARVAGAAAVAAKNIVQPGLPITAAATVAATAAAEDPNAAYRQRKLAEGDLCWALNELTAEWLSRTAEGKLVAAHRPRLPLPLFADSTFESAAAPTALIEAAQGVADTLAVDAAAFCLTETAAAAVPTVPESNGVTNNSSSSSAVGAWQRCVVSGYDPATALFHGVWAGSAEPWALPALLVCFSDCSSSTNTSSSYSNGAKYSSTLPLPAPQGKAAATAAAAAAARGRRGGLARRQAVVTRLTAALCRRRSCEALLAYAQYVKCMPVDAAVVGTLGDGTARRALALALGPAAERAFGAAAANGASHRPG
jgi:hypothetical protein